MTDSELNNSEFPPVGVWGEEKWTVYEDNANEDENGDTMEKNSLQSSNWGKSLSLEFVDKDCGFKRHKRRLSDPLPSVNNFAPSASKSTDKVPNISKILNLLFMQMVTSEAIPDGNTLSLQRSENRLQLEKHFYKVLRTLMKTLTKVLNTPSEAETLQYCRTVLLEVTADLDSATVIGYFLQALQTSDQLLKHAAIALLPSYCTENKLIITVIPHLLHRLLFLYIEEDENILKYLWESVNAVIKRLKYADQMKILNDVSLAIKFSICCFQEKKNLPGLCYPEGIEPILIIYEQAILKGTMRDKKHAAKALQQLIVFATEDALRPYICKITSLLIRNIRMYKQFTCYYQPLGIIVETLAHLIAKAGKLLNLYYPELIKILFQTVERSNKFLYVRSVTALSYLVHFYDELECLYQHIFCNIRDRPFLRVQMLHLLHYVFKHACVEIPEKQRNKFINLVNSFLSSNRETVRTAASACLATMRGSLPNIEINRISEEDFLDDNTRYKQLRNDRSVELMIALKEDPASVFQREFENKITEELRSYVTTDDLEVVLNGVNACGYYICYKVLNQEKVHAEFLEAFCNAMNHSSEEVNVAFAIIVHYIARKAILPMYIVEDVAFKLFRARFKMLRTERFHKNCQYALYAVLNLSKDDKLVEAYMNTLDPIDRSSFEAVLYGLKKMCYVPLPEEKDLDSVKMKLIQFKELKLCR